MMECMLLFSSIPVSGSDYEPLSANLSFPRRDLRSCVHIDIIDDCTVEKLEERFEVNMYRTPGLLSRIKLDVADSLVYITDNDRKILYCRLCATSKAVYGACDLIYTFFFSCYSGSGIYRLHSL